MLTGQFDTHIGEGRNGAIQVMSSAHKEKTTGSMAVSSSTAADGLNSNLRQLDRLASLGLIAASVAHEVKNGLVAINTFTQVLLEKSEDPEMAGMVQKEIKRIDSLVTQMLRYASPRPAESTTVPIHRLLDHSLRLLEHQMAGRTIVLKREYDAKPGVVKGDESQLQQVFMNLMLNAVESIDGNGQVTVRTEVVQSGAGIKRLKVHISDTGAGISPEHLSHVFDPFFTTKKNGTGLGLAICRHVAEEHNGSIEVQSKDGCGSTFTVALVAAS